MSVRTTVDEVTLVDAELGISLTEAKSLTDQFAAELSAAPTLTARPKPPTRDAPVIGSFGANYEMITLGLTSGAFAAAGGLLVRSITQVVLEFVRTSAARRVKLKLSDGTELEIEGKIATAESVAKLLNDRLSIADTAATDDDPPQQ